MKLEKPIKNVFNNIKPPVERAYGKSGYLGNGYWKSSDSSESVQYENINSFQVGKGNTAIKMDSQGQWFGGNKFEDGRIKISNNGNLTFKDSDGFQRILIGEEE